MTCDDDLDYLPIARKLPAAVDSELVARLHREQEIRKVVRWLRGRWLGELNHYGHHDLRKIVIELRSWLKQNPEDRNASAAATTASSESPKESAVQKVANRIRAEELLTRAAEDACDELQFARGQRERGVAVDTSKPRMALCTIARLARELGIEQEGDADEPIPSTRNANACGGSDPITDVDIHDLLTPREEDVAAKFRDMPPPTRMLLGEAMDVATEMYQTEREIKQLEAATSPPVPPAAAPAPPAPPEE